jgi:hypothetical protein
MVSSPGRDWRLTLTIIPDLTRFGYPAQGPTGGFWRTG